jgi:redox-sensitive bicupin YhaK (pirin superfamily)
VLGDGDAVRVAANASQDSRTPKLELYVMGGLPIRDPAAHYGLFVMNTRDELRRSRANARAVEIEARASTLDRRYGSY